MAEQDNTSNNKRIAKNTIMLYLRMGLSIIVSLYTSRVVLQTLGVDDYGIYGVVGGVVAMFSFLNAAMSGATSRFLTYEIGKGDYDRLCKTFSSAMIIHVLIGLLIVVLAETLGLWFLCNKLVIPEGRMFAAHVVYQFSIISMFFGVTQVPYNATIIAHEKMDVYAYVELLNVFLKLGIVYLLVIGNFDKLILYSALTLAVSVLILMIYRVYCLHHFSESSFHIVWDKTILKPMLSFSGWNMYLTICFTGRQQGTNFILNIFGGTILNAAASLAATVDGIITGFAYNVVMAFRPPLIKLYANRDFSQIEKMFELATLISLVLYFFASVPLICQSEFVLKLWLGQVPEHTIAFLRIILISSTFSILNSVILILVHATGDVKKNSIMTGTVSILLLVPLYFLLKIGINVDIAYSIVIISNVCISIINYYCVKKQIPNISLLSVIIKNTILIAIGMLTMFVIVYLALPQNIVNFLLILIVNILFQVTLLFCLLSKVQREIVFKMVDKIIHHRH